MIRAFLIGSVSAIALASAAFASDLPTTKGPAPFVPPPPPVFSWTGFYVGGNAGLSGGNFTQTVSADPSWASFGATSMGFSGGGQIGYNYEFPTTNFVAGVEADFQGSTLAGTYVNYSEGDSSLSYGEKSQSQVDWWGTARARLGYAFGNILPYATGGFAYGRVQTSYDYWDVGLPSESYSYSSTQTGWTAGGGVEYAITHNLTLKAEYLYTDLGSFNFYTHEACVASCLGSNSRIQTTFSTVRAGLNWKFDWMAPPAPFLARD
ncbi:MAG: outer membrane protein [Methylovirgula sp.]